MIKSKIEWTDRTWNPVTGCSKVSEGCRNCYADAMFTRFESKWGKFNDVKCHEDKLQEPFRLKKPQKIFVNSMSDLFHEKVPFEFIDKVLEVIEDNPHHIFQVLTKRPSRMADYLYGIDIPENLWIGISVEDQKAADERIPILLNIPAKVRFLSCEPLLGELYLDQVTIDEGDEYGDGGIFVNSLTGETWMRDGFEKDMPVGRKINWVIVGGESGPKARPMHPDWVRSIRNQCESANVPFFFKQWGEYYPREQGEWNTYPLEDYDLSDDRMPEFVKVGKTKAGSLLDGHEWKQFPEVERGIV